jgi:hypothetical protein
MNPDVHPASSFEHMKLISDAALIHHDGIILFVIRAIFECFVLTAEKTIRQHVLSFIYPDNNAQLKDQISKNHKAPDFI